MNKKNYHKYVFDEKSRSFIGEFDQMYKMEKTEKFDSWHQNDVNILDNQSCLQIIEQTNFYTIVDIGCVKNGDELVSEFNIHFNIVERIKFISRGIIILFGKSKLIGEV